MGRGRSKVGSSGGGFIGSMALPGVKTAGDVSFDDMMAIANSNLTDSSSSFSRTVTVLPKGYVPESGKKSDLATLVNKYNIRNTVVNMYRDRAGANDLQRLFNLGFQIQAQYKDTASPGSAIPPKDYYFLVR